MNHRIRSVFLAGMIVLLTSCTSSEKKQESVASADSSNVEHAEIKQDTIIITATRVTAGQLPRSIKFRGKLNEAWQWTDRLGENILITSYVAPYPDQHKNDFGDPGRTAELHAFHFLKKDTAYKLLWKISDAEKSCAFDITSDFLKNAITITDLDNDGIAETTVQYRLACRSDVSPAAMKLIMHEDTLKYSLRGLTCDPGNPGVCVTEKDANLETQPPAKKEWQEYTRQFGRYETEKEFAKAPPQFLIYARNQWLKFVKESFQ